MIKSVLREIKSSLGRYVSMLAIIALGSGFLSGLLVTRDAMVRTLDESMKGADFYDWRLISTLGYESGDDASLAAEDGVRAAEGAVAADALCTVDGAELVMAFHSVTESVNTLTLRAGRMPERAGECVADSEFFSESDIGTVLRLSAGNSEDTLEKFAFDGYEIVGLASSPLYINYERGSTSLGTGVVSAFVYIPLEGFDLDYFTDIYLALDGDEMIYSDGYKALADGSEERVTELAKLRANHRYDRIVGEANDEIDEAQGKLDDARRELEDGQRDYDEGKAEADAELADALAELEDAERKLADGRRDYADGVRELEEKVAEAEQEIADAEAELADALTELTDGELDYLDARRELRDGENDYADGLAQYEDGLSQTIEAQKEIDKAKEELRDAARELSAGQNRLNAAKKELLAQEEAFYGQPELEGLAAMVGGMMSGGGIPGEGQPGDDAGNAAPAMLESEEGEEGESGDEGGNEGGNEGGDEGGDEGGEGDDSQQPAFTAKDLVEALQQESKLPQEYQTLTPILTENGVNVEEILGAKQQFDAGWQSYNAGASALAAGDRQYYSGLEKVRKAEKELDDAKKELDDAKTELADARAELDDGWEQLTDARAELDDGWAEYNDGVQELADAKVELADSVAEAEQELADARWDIAKAERDIKDGWQEYYDGKAEAEQELADAEKELEDGRVKLADAEAELADARAELDDLERPEVYVLGRGTNVGYVCFESDAEIVSGISGVFPVFFFLVAALVCITTMTRAMDEQRTQIGVLKALGFSSGSIMGRYMLYSGSAALIGCTLGFFLGSYFMPLVIWETYQIMYSLGEMTPYFNYKLGAVSTLSYLAVSSAATYMACRHELQGVPAELLRPKPPKTGRRVLLERVGFIWKRLSFLYKVSIRNIFRYRQRLFMMVLGIGGCTALLLTGYGIRDSIQDVVDFQYDEISLYEYTVSFSDAQTPEDAKRFAQEISGELADAELVYDLSMDVDVDGVTKLSHIVAPVEGRLEGLLDLHYEGEAVPWPGKGEAVVCVNLAETFDLQPGDTITVRDEDMNSMTLTVSGIFENYVYNYVYVSAETLTEGLGGAAEAKTVYANPAPGRDINAVGAKILDCEGVSAVSSAREMRDRVGAMMSSLDYIVWMVVVCSGALAFIVLYNLTNININERIREIATIKVLGFYRGESASYVFRENMMLTVMGAVVGLPAGALLHAYIVSQIRVDLMYFAPRVFPMSYVYAFGFTLLFAVIVDVFMYFKLERINMAEALKSIE